MPDTSRQIAAAIGRLTLYWRAASWQTVAERGLNPAQAEILGHLARRGPARQVSLAAALGVSAASLSDSVASLLAKGLVARHPDPKDGRAVRVALTETGAALQAALPEAPAPLLSALDDLPETEAGAALRALSMLIRALQEARAIPVQRLCVTCTYFQPYRHDDAAAPHHCGFVDAAFGDAALRIDCADHEDTTEERRAAIAARLAAVG
ncbi:MarR family winged helix-turn-helix transcriptional regulator [Roseovarius autotrophicus]|uniref:MarR family winged helix-turn-helix transcriptional regulator n=1 Tax=Roseovarius autotrophicus TaxID=2824121 RepID=UPI0019F68DED|nr:MarR family winged helix-turn-helix transcriptional regulator [Roseovarius autotrophicus]MBE0455468.1 winged helix-turn-helix transcriptional regulator [Roseovarius sp.]